MEDLAEGVFRLAFRAIIFVARVLFQIVFEAIVQFAFYWTGRIVVPVATLGRVRVAGHSSERAAASGDGRELSANVAMLIGMVVWFAAVPLAIWLICSVTAASPG